MSIFTVTFIVLLVLKLTGAATLTWWVVASPLAAYGVLFLVWLIEQID